MRLWKNLPTFIDLINHLSPPSLPSLDLCSLVTSCFPRHIQLQFGSGSGGGGGQRSTKAGLLSGERVCVVHIHSPAESERAGAKLRQREQSRLSKLLHPLMQAENQTAAHALLKAPASRESIPYCWLTRHTHVLTHTCKNREMSICI